MTTPIRRLLTALATASVAILAAAVPALAAPVVDGEFDLSANPERIAVGPDQAAWVTLAGAGNDLARIAADGAVTEYDIPDFNDATGIAAGPNGRLWVTLAGKLGHFDPGTRSAARRRSTSPTSPRAIWSRAPTATSGPRAATSSSA